MENFSVRHDVLSFLRKPDYAKFQDISEKEKVSIVFKVFLLTFLGLLIVNIPLEGLKQLGFISEIEMETKIFLKTLPTRHIGYKPYFLTSILFLVPIFEEIAFRLCLTKFRVNYFIVSVSVLLGMGAINFIGDYSWIPKSYLILFLIKPVFILLFAALTGGFLWLFRKKIEGVEPIWNKNAAVVVYFMSILFAVDHLNNMIFEPGDLIFMPLILSPFLVYGLSFGYLRIRLGIRYSIALHMLINGIAIGLPELIGALKASTAIGF